MGKYTKRADGRYYARIRTGTWDSEGKPIVVNVYAKSESELKRKVSAIRTDRDRGMLCHDPNMTFGEYAEKWITVHKVNKGIRTQEMYSCIIRRHIDLLTNRRLKDITQSDVQKQINTVSDKPRTAQQLKQTIKQILDCAVMDGLVLKNVCVNVELPRIVVSDKRAFTDAEKDAIKGADYTDIERAFIYVLYCTGMRPGEVYGLTWSDIDFKREEITVNRAITFRGETPNVVYPKTNAGIRTIQAPTMLFKALSALRGTNTSLVVFCGKDGQYMTKSAYSTLYTHCKHKFEMKLGHATELTAYYFRHNYATTLYYSGISLKEAIRLMGHTDTSMIMRVYSHLDAEKENTKEKIAKLF